jgi:hypothetical protein
VTRYAYPLSEAYPHPLTEVGKLSRDRWLSVLGNEANNIANDVSSVNSPDNMVNNSNQAGNQNDNGITVKIQNSGNVKNDGNVGGGNGENNTGTQHNVDNSNTGSTVALSQHNVNAHNVNGLNVNANGKHRLDDSFYKTLLESILFSKNENLKPSYLRKIFTSKSQDNSALVPGRFGRVLNQKNKKI